MHNSLLALSDPSSGSDAPLPIVCQQAVMERYWSVLNGAKPDHTVELVSGDP